MRRFWSFILKLFGQTIDDNLSEAEKEENWNFSQKTQIYFENEWVINGSNPNGFETLWNDCISRRHKEVIKKLIENIYYLSNEESFRIVRERLQQCYDAWGLNNETTMFVGIRKHKYADGSSALLQLMKSVYASEERSWREYQFISELKDGLRYGKNGKMRNENFVINDIVIVDDFVGSGKTAHDRIIDFVDKLHEDQPEIRVHFFALAGTSKGKEKVENTHVNVSFGAVIDNGINMSFSSSEQDFARELILELENILAVEYNEMKLIDHSLGWGKAEALYVWNINNVPNNVYPIFWWKYYKDKKFRTTMFNRL